ADSVDQLKRFEAARWATTRVDGHDPEAVAAAIAQAQRSDRPSLIACRTTIGFGAPQKAGTEKSHGSPLAAEEIAGARARLGWWAPAFEIPADVREAWHAAARQAKSARAAWNTRFDALDPAKRAEFVRRLRGELPKDALPTITRRIKETLTAA